MTRDTGEFYAEQHVVGGRVVVRIGGECDAATLDRLNNALAEAVELRPAELLVDLGGVTFLDSLTVASLMIAAKRVRAHGGSFRVVHAGAGEVRRAFEIIGLDRYLLTSRPRARLIVLRVLDAVPPAAGAAVMGTGIVSVGLRLDHQLTLSRILFAVTIALWLGLVTTFLRRVLRQRERWRREARTPDLLTVIAGTAVLGARVTLLGQAWAGYLLLALALCLWGGLLPPVLQHWRSTPTVGVSFLLTVATESLAVLGALLAIEAHAGWLAVSALAPLAVGLAAYVHALVRVDLAQLHTGRGDQWIFGGALAIAALACAQVTTALHVTGAIAAGRRPLEDATLVLWVAAVLWLPALLAGELISPRLHYDSRRWSTVFPLGMYAAATIATGNLTGSSALVDAGRIWVWPAFALWIIVFAGLLARTAALLLAGSGWGRGRAKRTAVGVPLHVVSVASSDDERNSPAGAS